MRTRRYQLILLLLIGLFLLPLLSRCGTRSDRKVEARLQELYGKPFAVITSNHIPADEQAEGIWDARVYIAAPEDDPYDRFFVYSTIEGEIFGGTGFTKGLSDTYELGKLKRLFEESAKEAGVGVSFTYNRWPFKTSEEYYYSEICINITVNPQNAERVCEFLSDHIQQFVNETGLTPGDHLVGVIFALHYREDEWPEDQYCSANFWWSDNLNWNEAQQEYVRGPLDYRVETIQNTLFHEIEEYKADHPELTEKTDAVSSEETKPTLPSGIYQLEDGTFMIQGDKVAFIDDEETHQKGVQLWSEETQRWSVYLWNEETQQYDCQTEP